MQTLIHELCCTRILIPCDKHVYPGLLCGCNKLVKCVKCVIAFSPQRPISLRRTLTFGLVGWVICLQMVSKQQRPPRLDKGKSKTKKQTNEQKKNVFNKHNFKPGFLMNPFICLIPFMFYKILWSSFHSPVTEVRRGEVMCLRHTRSHWPSHRGVALQSPANPQPKARLWPPHLPSTLQTRQGLSCTCSSQWEPCRQHIGL